MYYFFKNIFIFFVAVFCMIFGVPNKDAVCMIGHRGYSSKHVDNTEESFIAAAKHGSGGCETDVRITKDNKLILSHGGEAEYVDGTKLVISDSTYAELTAKPLKNEYTDNEVYLCSFERYLEICKEYNLICFIELKGEFTDEQIKRVFDLAKEIYDIKKCSLQSFSKENLLKAHELCPDLPLMLTYGRGERDEHVDWQFCIDNGFDIDVDYSVVNKDMVKAFHDNGLKVGVWTCNDKLSLYYSCWVGADYIESDVS